MGTLESQFTNAFEAYSDELFRHCLLRLSERERAVELTQECFTRAWEYTRKGNTIEEWRPFLYRTLRNLIIDEYRKRKTTSLETIAQEHDMDVELLLPQDDSNTLEKAVERFEAREALARLQELPDPYREALALRYVEGLSPKEIGNIVGESENAVSVRVHRGLKKLKDLLEQRP